MTNPTSRKSGSSRKVIGDRARREFLQRTVATAVLTSPVLAGIAAAADVVTRSRFLCVRCSDAELPVHHFLTVIGGHQANFLKGEIDALSYGRGQKTGGRQHASGHVLSSTWSPCPSHAGIKAGLGLIALLDNSPNSREMAVAEAQAWLAQGAWVYLAVSKWQVDLSLVIQAMSVLSGNWQIFRCNDFTNVAQKLGVAEKHRFVSNAVSALLDPHENYCMPCLDMADWYEILNGRLVDLSYCAAQTLAAIQAELRRLLDSAVTPHSFVAVVSGPIEFASLKMRFALQDQLREGASAAQGYLFAAQANDAKSDYSMYLFRCTPAADANVFNAQSLPSLALRPHWRESLLETTL